MQLGVVEVWNRGVKEEEAKAAEKEAEGVEEGVASAATDVIRAFDPDVIRAFDPDVIARTLPVAHPVVDAHPSDRPARTRSTRIIRRIIRRLHRYVIFFHYKGNVEFSKKHILYQDQPGHMVYRTKYGEAGGNKGWTAMWPKA